MKKNNLRCEETPGATGSNKVQVPAEVANAMDSAIGSPTEEFIPMDLTTAELSFWWVKALADNLDAPGANAAYRV